MDGVVVHAKKGQRDSYRPIQSPLCSGSTPREVIDGLLGLHEFKTLYVADLDALMGKGNHAALLHCLQRDYPNLQFWVDCGWPAPGFTQPRLNRIPVIGSESWCAESDAELSSFTGSFILSLDFMGDGLLGDPSLLERSTQWPDTVIIMSLAHVGGEVGPDFRRLEAFRAGWPEKKIIAAGGVRDTEDLIRLESLGVGGVLLASALHSGALDPSILRRYACN